MKKENFEEARYTDDQIKYAESAIRSIDMILGSEQRMNCRIHIEGINQINKDSTMTWIKEPINCEIWDQVFMRNFLSEERARCEKRIIELKEYFETL